MGGGGGFVKKIIILIGNYCSGKTESALNLAVRAAERGERTQVIDLDRINDYFRMSDHIRVLGEHHIDLVSPSFVGRGLTQTVMPARVASAFDGDWDLVVFDEYHFGAWRDSAQKLFSEQDDDHMDDADDAMAASSGNALNETWLPIQSRFYLYLSGTPFRALNSGEFIEEQIGYPITMVSNGPGRDDIIYRTK